jgi:hypothetical protein
MVIRLIRPIRYSSVLPLITGNPQPKNKEPTTKNQEQRTHNKEQRTHNRQQK